MINANELRRGNKLMMNGKVHTVVEIKEHHTKCSYFDGVTIVPRYAFIENEKLEPIELTEEILLGCGFIKRHDGAIRIHTRYLEIVYFKGKLYISIEGQFLSLHHKSLHQIQNFFNIISGQELTTNL